MSEGINRGVMDKRHGMVRPLKWQDEILALLVEDGPLYFMDAFQRFKKYTNNMNVVKRNLDGLIEKKLVKKEKKGRHVYYSATYLGIIVDMTKKPFDETGINEYFDSLDVIVAKHYDETISEDELKMYSVELKELSRSLRGLSIYERLAWAKERRIHKGWIEGKERSMSPFYIKFEKDLEHLEDRRGKR